MARDARTPTIRHQLLVYPVVEYDAQTPSAIECGQGYFLDREFMLWFWDHYLRSAADRWDWRASPIRADNLGNLPPALVITAEYDPLRDEGEAYAVRLQEAGVPTKWVRFQGQLHGFFTLGMQSGKLAAPVAAAALREAFAAQQVAV